MAANKPGPRPDRRRVMAQIVRLCARTDRSADELARLTASTRESVHVLLHRLRAEGAIVTINPGRAYATHATPALAERRYGVTPP